MHNKIIFLIFFLFLNVLSLSARTLYINVVDTNNMSSFLEYYGQKSKNFKSKDAFIAFDAKTMQSITSIEFDFEDVLKYKKNKRFFTHRIEKILNLYVKKFNQKSERYEAEFIISSESNDFARELKKISQLLKIYQNQYTNIRVLFFGESYLHNAYGHDFSKGIPTDGFIYSNESEFNTFPDISMPDVKFAIFFDDDPGVSKNRLFRFYRKLIAKKFNSKLDTFNDTSTWDADRDLKYADKIFKRDKIQVIGEKYKSNCVEHDISKVIYLDEKGKIEVSLENICRKDSMITFYHNGEATQKEVDQNGKVKVLFNAMIGNNIVTYFDLNGDKREIYNERVSAVSDDVKFELDEATMNIKVYGYNPLRNNKSQIKIYYKTTGSNIYIDVKDGKFETTVPATFGKNEFIWKDMNGKEHIKEFNINAQCADKINLNKKYAQENGIANIKLSNDCREDGSIVEFYYQNITYKGMVVNHNVETTIILNADINDLYYKNFDGDKKKLATIEIHNFEDLIRFTMTYTDNVVALMNIFEPNINIDVTKPIKGIDYNQTKQFQEGHLHPLYQKSHNGKILIAEYSSLNDYLSYDFIKSYTQIYVTHKSKIDKGNLYFYIDYFSRHGSYDNQPPLCGKRSLGGIVINYEILDGGSIETGKKFLNPSRCKKSINDGSLQPNNKATNLIFIKKVEIK